MKSTRNRRVVIDKDDAGREFDRNLESKRYSTIVFTPERIEGDNMSGDINFTVPCAARKIEDPSTFFLLVAKQVGVKVLTRAILQ